MKLKDTFNGNDKHLVACIEALLEMDATGALVPHGVGGQARVMLSAAAVRLDAYREERENRQSGMPEDVVQQLSAVKDAAQRYDQASTREAVEEPVKHKNIGSNLDDMLAEDGILQGVTEKECLKMALHYPGHWDTAAYPNVYSALSEVLATFECEFIQQKAADHSNPDGVAACVAAIQFAIEHEFDEGMQFLRCWNEGSFNYCRQEWPEAPDECYIGADPLFKPKCDACNGTGQLVRDPDIGTDQECGFCKGSGRNE